MKERIIDAAKAPEAMEALYRSNPSEFEQSFPEALRELPESTIMQVWHQRLSFEAPTAAEASSNEAQWQWRDIQLTVVLALVAGTLAKLPQFFGGIDPEEFYPRNLGGILGGVLLLFFCFQRRCSLRTTLSLMGFLAGSVVYLNLIPSPEQSDLAALACLHLPFAFWSLIGIAFVGGAWGDLGRRMNYVRYNGEMVIYCSVLVLGGIVLTGLTIGLFELIGISIGEWYMEKVGVYGAVGIPLVASLLITRIIGDRIKIAPLLAKIFTPLFLLMVVVYLIAMVVNARSPFSDRDFLIAFNGLLLVVLGLCVFSISERDSRSSVGVPDYLNMGLVAVTLTLDLIALAAILFRLSSYGFTPNRVAVLGANLLAFCHLAGIFYYYIRFVWRRCSCEALQAWIVRFLPAYTIWSLLVAFLLPLLFRIF